MSEGEPSKFYDPGDQEQLANWDAPPHNGNNTLALANPSNSTLLDHSGHALDMTPADMVYYSLSMVALILFCFCTRSRVPDERFRIAAAERRARWLEQRERRERMTEPEYRGRLVQKALVVKKVIEEKDGQLTLGDLEGVNGDDDLSAGGGSRSIDSMDENTSTCVVCLDPFRVGDVVAWSRTHMQDPESAECNHIFHRECIVSWLSQPMHDDCPSCRAMIVQEEEQEDDFSGGEPESYADSVFVIMHGLVSKVRRASYSLIGQSIDFGDEELDMDSGSNINRRIPKMAPPSPMRRVFSLEGRPQIRHSTSSLRRRPSDRSVSSQQSGSLVDPSDLDAAELSPLSQRPRRLGLSPQMLRRVVSDFAQTPMVPLTRASSMGRRLSRRLQPRGQDYQSVSSYALDDDSEHSLDASEQSLEEEDLVIHQFSSSENMGDSTSHSRSQNEE